MPNAAVMSFSLTPAGRLRVLSTDCILNDWVKLAHFVSSNENWRRQLRLHRGLGIWVPARLNARIGPYDINIHATIARHGQITI